MASAIIWLIFRGFFSILSWLYSSRPLEMAFSRLMKAPGINLERAIRPTTAFDSVLEKMGTMPLTRSPWGKD